MEAAPNDPISYYKYAYFLERTTDEFDLPDKV